MGGQEDVGLDIIAQQQSFKKAGCSTRARMLTHTLSHTHSSICWVKTQTATHQCIKHEDVIVVSLRVFHHDVEQGVQSVLQKLHQERKDTPIRWPICQSGHFWNDIFLHPTDLDHLLPVNKFKFLQVFFEEFRPSPPLKQSQQAHWRGRTHIDTTCSFISFHSTFVVYFRINVAEHGFLCFGPSSERFLITTHVLVFHSVGSVTFW